MYELFFLIGRVVYGGFFILMSLNHFTKTGMMSQYAASKNIPAPKYAVLFSGLLILLGGLGLVLGLYAQYAIFLVVLFLVMVSGMMHNFWAVQDPQQKQMEMINFAKNMALAGAALMMLMSKDWPFSISL